MDNSPSLFVKGPDASLYQLSLSLNELGTFYGRRNVCSLLI